MKLVDDFVPRRGMRGGHLQTLIPTYLPRENRLPPAEDRLFSVEPETQILCHCHWQPDHRAERLTVVIVHGLEGSAESQYVIGNANKAWAAGWNAVRMNIRNCGGTQKLSATLYHSGLSGDVRTVVETLIAQNKLQRVALIGYSMGGNQVLKAAGEWGADRPKELKAVAAVSPGMDLDACATLLHQWQNRIYELHFVWSLKKNMRRKAKLFPGKFDAVSLRGLRSIRDFDEHITAYYSGFTGASDYYYRASAARVVERITVPTLILHALDDPFITITPESRAKLLANPNIRLLETRHGGHCGFLAAAQDGFDGRWAEAKIQQFLQSV